MRKILAAGCLSAVLLAGAGPPALSGQEVEISLPYSVFTIEDGLAQMQVRDIFIDSSGYVWIATQGGLSGYDGSAFHTYTGLGAVSEDYITRVARGCDGVLGSAASGIFSFNGVSAEVYRPTIGGSLPELGLLFQDAGRHIWVEASGEVYILEGGELVRPETVYPALAMVPLGRAWGDPGWEYIYLMGRQNRFYAFSPSDGALVTDSTTFAPSDTVALHLFGRTAETSSIIFSRIAGGAPVSIHAVQGAGLELVASKGGVAGQVVARSANAPWGYQAQKAGRTVMYFRQDSVYLHADWLDIPHVRFSVDGDQKTYIGTDGGLYVVYHNGLQNIRVPDCGYPWSVVPREDGVLLAGCYRSGVQAFTAAGDHLGTYGFPSPKMDPVFYAQILSNYAVGDGITAFGSIRGFYFLKQGAPQLEHFYLKKPAEALHFDTASRRFLAGSDKLYVLGPSLTAILDSIAVPQSLLNNTGITDIEPWGRDAFWVAANFGLLLTGRTGMDQQLFPGRSESFPCQGAVSLVQDENGSLWVGGTCGLLRYAPASGGFIKVLPGLIDGRANQVQLLPGRRLACVTNNKLFILDISRPEPVVRQVFTSKNGLHLLEPAENGISVSEGRYLWMASASGIQRLDLEKEYHTERQPLLRVMAIGEAPVGFGNDGPGAPSIQGRTALFTLSLIGHSGKRWKFQYAKNGGPFSPWQESAEILVSGLDHGKNELVFRANWMGNSPDEAVETVYAADVFIPFWERRTTLWLMGAALLLAVAFVFWEIIRHRRKMKRLMSMFYLNRLKSIQAYLNPHFLFNALTSVQDHILNKDRKEGSRTVVSLSRILRQVLDFGSSEKEGAGLKPSMARLSQEISLLKDYLYLENKQQTVPFTFDIDIGPGVTESDPLIPPLLIQPFVENAIKHAFDREDTDKRIDVRIRRKENMLVIRVLDNGRGISFERSGLRRRPSLGIKLARERMSILNKLGYPNSLTISEARPRGTAVEIATTILT